MSTVSNMSDTCSELDFNESMSMISLAPSETSSVPLFCHLELDEFGGIQVQDYEQNLLNLAAERTRREEDFGDVEDLQGEELTPEDIERAESSCHGAIGTELDEEGNEVPVRRDSSRDIKIMYGGRDILDLGANLRSEFWELNRWQRGPEPMRPAEPAPRPAPTNIEPISDEPLPSTSPGEPFNPFLPPVSKN